MIDIHTHKLFSGYFADDVLGQCKPCHAFCSDCRGPTPADCFACAAKRYKVFRNINVKDGQEQVREYFEVIVFMNI